MAFEDEFYTTLRVVYLNKYKSIYLKKLMLEWQKGGVKEIRGRISSHIFQIFPPLPTMHPMRLLPSISQLSVADCWGQVEDGNGSRRKKGSLT